MTSIWPVPYDSGARNLTFGAMALPAKVSRLSGALQCSNVATLNRST
jgi:hypothetical protein